MENEQEFDINLDDLFKDIEPKQEEQFGVQENQEPTEEVKTEEVQKPSADETTKAVSERINTVRKKTENETQEKVAKELGYESYAELQKANEKKMLRDAGIEEDEIADVVNKLVEQKLANDPRYKKLEEFESLEKAKFVNSQLAEINSLSDNKYTSIDQLPKDTLDLWQKTGNLKQAFLATQGEALIVKAKTKHVDNGSTRHMATPGGTPTTNKTRALTEEEKAIWRSVMPDITEDELSKKTMNID